MHLAARILATASALLGRAVDTATVAKIAMPERSAADVEARTGIASRYWVEPGTTMASQGAVAVQRALEDAGLVAADLRRIIFTNSTGGDYLMPATANALADALGVADTCDCFDVNNACVGFLTSIDIAARSVVTGLGPVAVVSSEIGSYHIRADDPRPYVVFGDAAAAAIIGAARPDGDEGIIGSSFGNHGALRDTVWMGHAGRTGGHGKDETIRFHKSNRDITAIAIDGLERSARQVFAQSGLGWQDVDWVVPHQPNGSMLAQIVDHFGIAPTKVVPVVHEIGNVGSCSTAVGLDRLLRTRDVRPGHIILLIGVGAGLSYGALLYRVGQ